MADGNQAPPQSGSRGGRKSVKIQVHMTDEVARGQYSNMAAVNQSQTEFVLDFMYIAPQNNQAAVLSRTIVHPMQARRLMLALQRHVALYEKRYGRIPDAPPNPADDDLLH